MRQDRYDIRRTSLILALGLTLIASACSDETSGGADTGDVGSDTTTDMVPDGDATADMAPAVLRDLEVQMEGMDPHVTQLMEFRVVSDNGELVSRGILDTLPVNVFTWFQPDAVPEGDYTVEFYADLSGNGSYDAPAADHAWTLALPQTGTATVTFSHNTNFVDIGASADVEGGDFSLAFDSMDPHVGQLMELRVIHVSSGHVVGQYRLEAVTTAAFDIDIAGIIDDGEEYQVDFYADLNGNTFYDAPPADHAWRLTGTGTSTGLSLTFSHNTDFTDIEY